MKKIIYLIIPLFTLLVTNCEMGNSPSVYTLTTKTTPEDGGTISPSGGEFEAGAEIEITAEPAEGYLFDRWQNGLTGSNNPVSATFESDLEVTAVFVPKEYSLNISIDGEGTVVEEIVQDKSKDYEHGTLVRLTAQPADGWNFIHWEGDLEEGENPDTLLIEEEKNVTAVFEPKEYSLNISIDGEGTVDEEIVQNKAKDYAHGTSVRLTAQPADGWSFTRWEGDLEGEENPDTLLIEEEKNVTAVFTEENTGEIIISTAEASDITETSAVSGGNVSDDGGFVVTVRGVCRDTISSPDTGDACTDDGSGTGSFTSNLSDLTPATTYYIRAYATNEKETAYGEELTFTTEEDSPEPRELIIMPLGNSLTNDSRSRVKLWNLLTDDGHTIDYVGDQSQESSIPDPDHEGVGGIEIQGIIDKAASLMERHDPEYVNLMVGTNDIAWYFDETAAEIADRWNRLVQILLDNSGPDTYVVAATIPPVTSKEVGEENMEERDRAVVVARYNNELRSHIETRRENGDNIVLADVEDALDRDLHLTSDGVHLNKEGYEIMGTVYYEAIKSILEGE